MENCSFALHIPKYGSEAMEIIRVGSEIDMWSFAVDDRHDEHNCETGWYVNNLVLGYMLFHGPNHGYRGLLLGAAPDDQLVYQSFS